jgi:hypothetical protein
VGVARQGGGAVVEDDRTVLLHRTLRYHSTVIVETPPVVGTDARASAPALAGLSLPSLRRREHPAAARALVLVDPHGAFTSTMRRPLLLPCLLLAALFAVAPPLAYLASAERSGGVDVVLVDELRRSGRLDRVPAAARAVVIPRLVRATRVALPAGAALKRLAWILACAGASFALVRATRPDVRLAVVIACATVGAAPLFVGDVVGAATFLAHDVRTLDAHNAVLSNPAAWFLTGAAARGPWAALLQGFDVFELWACAWIAIGVGRAVGGRSQVPVVVVFGLHAAATLFAVVQAALR